MQNIFPVCSIKQLPNDLALEASRVAVEHNPQNAPSRVIPNMPDLPPGLFSPLAAAIMTSKWWRNGTRITVGFLERPNPTFKGKVLAHMNAWNKTANISFVESDTDPMVRVSTHEPGYWSYLGTDVLMVPKGAPTLNLERFTQNTPDSEYLRVVRHETGHTLGFVHEHSRKAIVELLDPEKTKKYFQETQGWPPSMVDAQILTPITEEELTGTGVELNSIMCYAFPGSITKNGTPIYGGTDITQQDYATAARLYPKPTLVVPPTKTIFPLLKGDGKPVYTKIEKPGQQSYMTLQADGPGLYTIQVNLNQGRQEPVIKLKMSNGNILGLPTDGGITTIKLDKGAYTLIVNHPLNIVIPQLVTYCWYKAG